jgi:cbb3-type cytochrome oxidase maturation protein
MTVLYLFLAIAIVIFISGLVALIWSIRSGQYDDLDTPAMRMLGDDVRARPPPAAPGRSLPAESNPAGSAPADPAHPPVK